MDEPRIKIISGVGGGGSEVTIAGNAAGLRALAERLEGLAAPHLAGGYHEHLDEGIDLEEGSGALIIERDDEVGSEPRLVPGQFKTDQP